ncbi:hypothetical protein D3C74_255470 [compost metagenome]
MNANAERCKARFKRSVALVADAFGPDLGSWLTRARFQPCVSGQYSGAGGGLPETSAMTISMALVATPGIVVRTG